MCHFSSKNAKLSLVPASQTWEFAVLYDSKRIIFGFWTDCQIKQGMWRCCLELWEILKRIFHHFPTFYKTKQSIGCSHGQLIFHFWIVLVWLLVLTIKYGFTCFKSILKTVHTCLYVSLKSWSFPFSILALDRFTVTEVTKSKVLFLCTNYFAQLKLKWSFSSLSLTNPVGIFQSFGLFCMNIFVLPELHCSSARKLSKLTHEHFVLKEWICEYFTFCRVHQLKFKTF